MINRMPQKTALLIFNNWFRVRVIYVSIIFKLTVPIKGF